MPKAILEFNLPEEQHEFTCATNSGKYLSALVDVGHWVRTQVKYEDADNINKETFRQMFYDVLDCHNINLDEIG